MTLALIAIIIFTVICFVQKTNISYNETKHREETKTNVTLERKIYKEYAEKIIEDYSVINNLLYNGIYIDMCKRYHLPDDFIPHEYFPHCFNNQYYEQQNHLLNLYEKCSDYYWNDKRRYHIWGYPNVESTHCFNDYKDGLYITDTLVKQAFSGFMDLVNKYGKIISLNNLYKMRHDVCVVNKPLIDVKYLFDLDENKDFLCELYELPPLPRITNGSLFGGKEHLYKYTELDKYIYDIKDTELETKLQKILKDNLKILSYKNIYASIRMMISDYTDCHAQYVIWAGLTRRKLHELGYAISNDGVHESDWQEWEKKIKETNEEEEKYPWMYHGVQPYEPSPIKKLFMPIGELKKIKKKKSNYCGKKQENNDFINNKTNKQ